MDNGVRMENGVRNGSIRIAGFGEVVAGFR
jgi:hypothetical protein